MCSSGVLHDECPTTKKKEARGGRRQPFNNFQSLGKIVTRMTKLKKNVKQLKWLL